MNEQDELLIITWQPSLSYVSFDGSNRTTVTIRDRKFVNTQC